MLEVDPDERTTSTFGDVTSSVKRKCVDGVLARDELDAFLRLTEGQPFDDDVFQWLVTTFDASEHPRGLTPLGRRLVGLDEWPRVTAA